MVILPSLLAGAFILFSHNIFTDANTDNFRQVENEPVGITSTLGLETEQEGLIDFTPQEETMTKMVVAHEGGYCSPELQEAIVDVIKNRVLDDNFPDNINDVLHAKNQFTAINNYYYTNVPLSESTSNIVETALRDYDTSQGALYFCNHDYIYSENIDNFFKSKEFLFEIDGVSFYK